MKLLASIALGALLFVPAAAHAVPITELIATVSKKISKKFLIDPRVNAEVTLIGQDPGAISYSDLLTILQTYGFAAVESGGYIRVVPDANIRHSAVALMGGEHPAAQHVSAVITVKTMPAAHLVPILRPLLPMSAHLAAMPCKNVLLIVDTYDNVRRIESVVAAMDTGAPYTPGKCAPPTS